MHSQLAPVVHSVPQGPIKEENKPFSLFSNAQIRAFPSNIRLPTILASVSYIYIVFHILIIRSQSRRIHHSGHLNCLVSFCFPILIIEHSSLRFISRNWIVVQIFPQPVHSIAGEDTKNVALVVGKLLIELKY